MTSVEMNGIEGATLAVEPIEGIPEVKDENTKIIEKFKLTNTWSDLCEEVIIKLFRESKDNEMLKSMRKGRNVYGGKTIEIWSKTGHYVASIPKMLDYCLWRFEQLDDITELMECILEYKKHTYEMESFTNLRNMILPLRNINEITKKKIKTSTWIEVLRLDEIQEQLKDKELVKKCLETLRPCEDRFYLFQHYIPTKSCVIM